jgi:NADH-quinone oxidoreductase subunit M
MLSLLQILLPFIGGMLVLFTDDLNAKRLSIFSSLAILGALAYTISTTNFDGGYYHIINTLWISSLGSNFHLGMDGISTVMLLICNVVTLFSILSTLKNNYANSRVFYALLLFMQGAMNGVFVSLDLLTYYIFWELALIPSYFLVILWGRKPIAETGLKFFFFTFIGSLFMLASIIYIGISSGSTDIDSLYGSNIPFHNQVWIYGAFILAYAIKTPIFPLHNWQPDTYHKSPSPVTIMLSGVMLKMALYSMIRWVLPITPDAASKYGIYILGMAAFGVFYAALVAWRQQDLKRLFAYSSMSHVGLIACGILTVSKAGLDGAMVQMVAHAITACALFYICHRLSLENNELILSQFGGIRHKAPIFAGFYLLAVMSSVGLPLTSGFPGEFMLFNAVFNYHSILGLLAASGVILGAIYMLFSYQKVMLGEQSDSNKMDFSILEVDQTDRLFWIPIALLIILLGFFPSIITHFSDASINKILEVYHSKLNVIPTN